MRQHTQSEQKPQGRGVQLQCHTEQSFGEDNYIVAIEENERLARTFPDFTINKVWGDTENTSTAMVSSLGLGFSFSGPNRFLVGS